MKSWFISSFLLLFILGCDHCPTKLRITDSRGIRSRCATEEEKREIMSNPELSKYVFSYKGITND